MTVEHLIEQRLDAAQISEPELRVELADHIWSAAEERIGKGMSKDAAVAHALTQWPVAQLERIRTAWHLARRQRTVRQRIPFAVGAGVLLYLLEVLLPGNLLYNGFLGGLSVGLLAGALANVALYQRLQLAQAQITGEQWVGFSPWPSFGAAAILMLLAFMMAFAPVMPAVVEERLAVPLCCLLALIGLWVRPAAYRWQWPEWTLSAAAVLFVVGMSTPGRVVGAVAIIAGAMVMAWNWVKLWRERALSRWVQVGKALLFGGMVLMGSLPAMTSFLGIHVNVFLPLAVLMVFGIGLLGLRFQHTWADLHIHFHHYYRGLLLPWALWMLLVLLLHLVR